MSDIPNDNTLLRFFGGDKYCEIPDKQGGVIVLTNNDLWMLIVCRTTLDGDWIRMGQAAGMVVDPVKKRAIAERLWRLEQRLDGLPLIPPMVTKLHLHRAHVWFNERIVSEHREPLDPNSKS